MRDPARIDRILTKLKALWDANPDWRLGQLLANASEPHPPMPEFFYMEDDTFEERLDSLLEYPHGTAAAIEAQRFVRIGDDLAAKGLGPDDVDRSMEVIRHARRMSLRATALKRSAHLSAAMTS